MRTADDMSSASEGTEVEGAEETKGALPDESGTFRLYSLKTSEGSKNTLLRAPTSLVTSGITQTSINDTFNLLMTDVSESMSCSWNYVIEGWNKSIASKLYGVTKLYMFSNYVKFLREDTTLRPEDNIGRSTNITEALKEIMKEVQNCKQSFVQVFFITDGGHTDGKPLPEEEIQKMMAPPGKTVNVYLLGITQDFPVNYSIDIRSRLHSGSANLPSLYWAKEVKGIPEQMEAIGSDLGSNIKMVLNQEGYILPGLPATQSIHVGEWLYFSKAPEELVGLKVTVNDEEEVEVPQTVTTASTTTLLDNLFPQWNSVLIQRHRRNQSVPKEVFDLMDSLFETSLENIKNSSRESESSIRIRLQRKTVKEKEVKYKTLMNMSRTIINIEGKYMNEIELANNILKSTVSGRKYDTQVLKIRGHGAQDYEKDMAGFFSIYKNHREAIRALPQPHPEECCRITMSSTLTDLQDDEFLLMQELDKFEFLKTFTMTGIPAYSPVRDAAQINPWTLSIHHMLVTPFTILSQRAIEASAEVEGAASLGANDKDVQLKADDKTTRFNIVIPTVPASAAAVLKPFVRSRLYAMLATFCILKDPHIIDFAAHLAALGCAWMKSVADHPPAGRPGYVTDRLASIVATAELYMDRTGITQYLNALASTPNKALMTETTDPVSNQTLKCESLIKPLFLTGMRRDKFTTSQLTAILELLLLEFIGRCLSNYKVNEKKATPFTDFFVPDMTDPQKRKERLDKESQSILDEYTSSTGGLLNKFYAPEKAQKSFRDFFSNKTATLMEQLIKKLTLDVNMNKVKHLKYIGGCGDVTFCTFSAWAQEVGIPEETILAACDPSKVTVYVCEALCYRNSKDRMDKEPRSHAECMKHITSQVCKEHVKALLLSLKEKFQEKTLVDQWRTEYMKVHEAVVRPLTLQEVVSEAQARGIDVTEETFKTKYKYNEKKGLLRNACQIPQCPYYLQANPSFNQHLAVERTPGTFPHSLHLVSMRMNSESVDKVVDLVISGELSGQNGRKQHRVTETTFVNKLKPDIEELLKRYKGMPLSEEDVGMPFQRQKRRHNKPKPRRAKPKPRGAGVAGMSSRR